jgi:hypothetical protein
MILMRKSFLLLIKILFKSFIVKRSNAMVEFCIDMSVCASWLASNIMLEPALYVCLLICFHSTCWVHLALSM